MRKILNERKCVWCGKTFAEHLDYRDPRSPVPRMPCVGLKSGFRSIRAGPPDNIVQLLARKK